MPESVLALFEELGRRGVPYMVVGMAGALLHGVPGTTKDIDLWFRSYTSEDVHEAVRAVGGIMVWRASPPFISGPGLDVFDVVYHMSGLREFDDEYAQACELELDRGVLVTVLPLERIVASKRASDRPKDRAVLPVLVDAIEVMRSRR
jgi:hypothetical protein